MTSHDTMAEVAVLRAPSTAPAPAAAHPATTDPAPPVTPVAPIAPHRAQLRALLRERTGLSDLQVADMEIGIFNWALTRADELRVTRSWTNPRFVMLYDGKARNVLANVDGDAYVQNKRLLSRLMEGEFKPHDIPTMHPENVFPERWRDVVEMKVRRDEYITTAKIAAMTDAFKCGRCKRRECSYTEIQTRSCDEPATLFIQCLACGNRWRIG